MEVAAIDSLLECLYQFARTQRVDAYLAEDGDYEENSSLSKKKWEWLEQNLPPEAVRQLEDFYGMYGLALCAEQEAVFRAGLALGLELSRL